ncbi:MAG TPA: glycoside hydrolase family 127 protein [Verrucomicrobiae bacterium]|nr:glycoside hydrolase family 127 protein [Verrucomicrobiae bacterium]
MKCQPSASFPFHRPLSSSAILHRPSAIGLLLSALVAPTLADPASPHNSPHVKFEPPSMTDARWTGGFWGQRLELVHKNTLPALESAMRCETNGCLLANFELVDHEGARHRGNNWSDGDVYKWIESMARVFALTRDAALDRKMDEWIDRIAKTQADDGYIGTQTQFNPEKKRWGMRNYHELYNMGHLLTAGAVHFQATGKTSLLDVAKKCADFLYATFQPRPKELAHFGWNPSNIMGLVDLYRATAERRYLELAGTFVDMRGSQPWPKSYWGGDPLGTNDPTPGDQTQDRVPLRRETQAVGHAVTGAYLYCGAADVVAETGEPALLHAITRIWDDIGNRKVYLTGGTGAYHQGLSIRQDRVHEAYGAAYDLPERTAYNETCANIGHAMFSRRLLALTGDARYGDMVERVLFNSMLSANSLDGRRFFYTNPLERRRDVPLLRQDAAERWPTWQCFCCPPSIARTIAGLNEWAWGVSDDAIWLHLFGTGSLQSSLAGSKLRIQQKSDYPWDGRIEVTVAEAPVAPFALKLRIPGWAEGASLKINGQPAPETPRPGSYAEIRREWKSGDAVELMLPMEPIIIEANPIVEHTRNQVAVMRGPLVYCLESADLPENTDIDDVLLPVSPKWEITHRPDLLGGVTVLGTGGIALSESPAKTALYQPARTAKGKSISLRLIPYYAWCNRGPGDMSVWLPAAR